MKKMTPNFRWYRCSAVALSLTMGLAGCASNATHDPRDPWEGWNRNVQSFNDSLDDYFMKPIAKGYQVITPSFVDRGITNFFNNVDDIGVIANDLLQLKFAQTGKDTGRFLINTTAGLVGFVDVASAVDLHKNNEDLDQTLGAWGIPSGPYLVLPLVGPSTPRGAVGLAGDTMSNPINWVNPAAYAFGSGTLKTIDTRADLLSATKIADEASVDRYEFIRNAYFQDRNYKIHDGNPPAEDDMEQELDEFEKLDVPFPTKTD
ncbi:MlaA family lipoprotein [Methyloterricola oryzae]|uniref:MlaA family lipoprotein n=1 Tax=Methyloterricola oryzae TaxID=1495050 RepID=UPI000AEB95D6